MFKTLDDPIALNAHDYGISNPTVGWIENGLIENCYDLPYKTNKYWFCRILAGSWVDWYQGMKLQNSDIVVNNGRLYRVIGDVDGREYISTIPPEHETGYETIEGIKWYKLQDGAIYNAGCRNIHFKNIFFKRDRYDFFRFQFDMNKWSRSYYPGSIAPVQRNFIFENIHVESKCLNFIYTLTPIENIKVINSDWFGNFLASGRNGGELEHPINLSLDKVRFISPDITFHAKENRSILLDISNSTTNNGNTKLAVDGEVQVVKTNLPFTSN